MSSQASTERQHSGAMSELGPLFHAHGGALERHELLDLGWTDSAIRRAIRDGEIVRIRFGTYAHGPTWHHSNPVERHRILARAVLGKLGRHVYASHYSAATLLGIEVWGVDLSEVQVGRLDGRTDRVDAGVRYHCGAIDPASLVEVDGVLVVPPVRAAVETALVGTLETGAVAITSAMRDLGVSAAHLEDALERVRTWAGAVTARRAAGLADARMESVGEVRSMCFFSTHAIPLPVPQHEIRDASGQFVGRSDFWWELFQHVGEFDGLVKYGRLNPYDTDVGRVLVDEKRREDAFRGLGHGVSRWTWSELGPRRSATTAERIKADLDRSRRIRRRIIDLGA